MKVLWFKETSSLYDQYEHFYHGCGWTESLQFLLEKIPEIELFVVFFHPTASEIKIINGTTYIPILRKEEKNPFLKLLSNWNAKIEFADYKPQVVGVINDYNPDIIHVFGTEGYFSQVSLFTNIPVVYHIQGLVNPYLQTYFPINQSKLNFYFNIDYIFNNIKGNSPTFEYNRFTNQAFREAKVLKQVRYAMGRTNWDNNIVKIYNPNVRYFHVDEVLRPIFYESNFEALEKNIEFRIVSTLSQTVYKGIDVILKTAKELKKLTDINFSWDIIGLDSDSKLLKHFEKTQNINCDEVNIRCVGKKTPSELKKHLLQSDVYVHPSYIDNSPNSVCEAQILGLPVIACNVGGVSSLIEHNVNGFLVPSNGVFEIIHFLKILNDNNDLRIELGNQGAIMSKKRHDKNFIIKKVLEVYKEIINDNN